RIYRVRPDIYPGGPEVDLTNDATYELTSASAIRAQYETDWTEWPADLGAPFNDVDENGVYDPTVDIPGVPGADQTLWCITNDLNPTNTADLYGASPMGIEAQITYWAYNQTGALGNMFFRKYLLVNKGAQQDTITDMYVSMWSDIDDGNAGDDFVGVDTVLSLQYCYNASPTDATYSPLPPPAIGFDFFQGPLVNGVAGEDRNKNGIDDAMDYGIFKGQVVGPGKINLPMTAAYYFANGDPNIGDPPQGDLDGSTQFYNFFQGKFGLSGATFTDLSTGDPTTYALNGDPLSGTGWLDGVQLPPGDRRQGSSSGPFTLAPGDTQEVVVAEICAGALPSVNNIAAIGLLKYYDGLAQVAYDNFFELPPNPALPNVDVVELPNQINLDWGENVESISETEGYDIIFNEENYKFQGYNVYQLPSQSASKEEGRLIATFDVQDNFLVIIGKDFDATTGQIVLRPQQLGNNTGISRYLEITTDIFTGTPLINGIKYYFAVTAYAVLQSYDKDVPIDEFPLITNVENVISILTVVPRSQNPEEMYTPIGEFTDITHEGTGDGGPIPYVVNPIALTGDEYEINFTQRQEIRDPNGDWVPASTVMRKSGFDGPDTLTGSSIDIAAVYGPQAGTLELQFSLDLVSVDYDWADGITLTFPAGVTILSVPAFEAGNGSISPEVVGNVINMGLVNHEYTQDGAFTGGEEWSVIVQASVPLSVDWIIYDDGYGGGPVDASGTTSVTSVGNASRLAKYWNLLNVTTSELKLENQGLLQGTIPFPPRDDIPANQLVNVPPSLQPIVDGFRIGVDGGYAAPTTIFSLELNGANLRINRSSADYQMTDFTYFGYADGFAATSLPLYGGIGGTTVIEDLQQDYELRWTGETGDTTINGKTVVITISGGSIATLIGASNYDLGDHPLNPNPGSTDPFTIRIPFEVWNIDTDEQVNLLVYDRNAAAENDPSVDGFRVWNTQDRMYTWTVNNSYTPTVIDPNSQEVADNATWNWVFFHSYFTTDDVIKVSYANPMQVGIDKYTFSPGAATFANTDKAKDEINKINVFPNPYYGVNSEELNKYNRFVTFSHLPTKATIRIFNLAGVLVKTIEKDNMDQFQRWDLANQNGLPVASGLYIAYIDMPDLGSTKILKVA
ncbi:MAG: T9SS type A sorting domain-containing protein, partial [Psychromonas sp.]|nr:T9SS type A sorting domain-containing protein [Psychromonas sp.]